MSDQEHFLTRWSRRKREVKSEPASTPARESAIEHGKSADRDAPSHTSGPPATAEPVFNPETLPPIDSIGIDSNIRDFLRPGVPAELTRAALRRAWVVDPEIRDFIGLVENVGDFNDPESIPGFGKLDPKDAEQLVAKIFGGDEHEIPHSDAALSASSTEHGTEAAAESITGSIETLPRIGTTQQENSEHEAVPLTRDENLLQCNNDDVMNDDVMQDGERHPERASHKRHAHGSALPK